MNYRLLNEGEIQQKGDKWHVTKIGIGDDLVDIPPCMIGEPVKKILAFRQDNTKAEALEWLQGLYDVWKGEFVATGHAPRLLALIKRIESEIGDEI